MEKSKLEELLDTQGPDAIFFGDWHGDLDYARNSLLRAQEKYPDIKVYYHVGDFGLGFNNDYYLKEISEFMSTHECVMLVTGGNHENWDMWDKFIASTDGAPYNHANSGLIFLPKQYDWNHSGRRYLSVGGASSIDRGYRNAGVDWWEQEEIQFSVVDSVCADPSLAGVDVLITHESSDSPVMPVRKRLGNFLVQAQWPVELLRRSEIQRKYVSQIIEAVTPKHHVHGHWHLPYEEEIDGVLVHSLGDNHSSHAENSFVFVKEQ